jgi:drug/metabolite transporter (DMT)-like permease
MGSGRPSAGALIAILATAVLAISTAAVLVRLSQAPSLVLAFYRLAIATVLLAPVALARSRPRQALASLDAGEVLRLAGVGLVLALHFAVWFESLAYTTVAASVVLVTLHPVFVGIASDRLFDEGLGRVGWVGVVVALGGGIVITAADARLSLGNAWGDVLALVGALAMAGYLLAGRGYRQRLPLLAYVVPVYAASALGLGLASWTAGHAFVGYGLREFAIFLALAIVPMILGHTLLNYALGYVSAPVVATTVLGEPIGSALLAWLILAEIPPELTALGAAIVLAGIGLVVFDEERGQA